MSDYARVGLRTDLTPELEMIEEINRLRRENGCDVALQRSAELTAAARTHSRDMAENHFFNHRGSDGRDRIARAQRAGYVGRSGHVLSKQIVHSAPPGATIVLETSNTSGFSSLLDDCRHRWCAPNGRVQPPGGLTIMMARAVRTPDVRKSPRFRRSGATSVGRRLPSDYTCHI